jgi:hypothetical protein
VFVDSGKCTIRVAGGNVQVGELNLSDDLDVLLCVDHSVVELFLGDTWVATGHLSGIGNSPGSLQVRVENGDGSFSAFVLYSLASIW